MLLKVKVYDSPSQENMEKELCKEKMVDVIKFRYYFFWIQGVYG